MGIFNLIANKLAQAGNYLGRKIGGGLNYIVSKSDVIRKAAQNPLVQQLAKKVPFGEKLLENVDRGLDIVKKGQEAIRIAQQFIPQRPAEVNRGEIEKQVVMPSQPQLELEEQDLD